MKIHEYQGKELFRKYGVPVPYGIAATTIEDALAAIPKVQAEAKTDVVVVKAQIHAGGRGKGGGVKVAKNLADAEAAVHKIFGMQLVTPQTGPEGKKVQRVVFHEITKRAINEAIEHPRELSDSLVSAQQARRALDYLVGFNLSPLLWKKVRRGLSAGRVQSPALRLICEREEEIAAFEAREYWTIEADCAHGEQPFPARLAVYGGQKVEQFTFTQVTIGSGVPPDSGTR